MKTRLRAWVLTACALHAVGCGGPGTGADCQSCDLDRAKIAELRAPIEAEPTLSSVVRQDGRGRFYVAPLVDPYKIAIFDSAGSYLGSFGQRGEGPGEFSEIRGLELGPGDTLYVLHADRISIFSPEHTFVRSTSSSAARRSDHIVLDSRGTIATGRTSTTYRGPPEALVWTHNGETVPRGLVEAERTASGLVMFRDTAWVLRSDYSVYRSADLVRWDSIIGPPVWYLDKTEAAEEGSSRSPSLAGFIVDEEHAWALIYEYKPLPPRPPSSGGEEPLRPLSSSELMEVATPRFDVWDRRGKLVASIKGSTPVRFVRPHLLHEVVEDSAGSQWINVYRFHLRQTPH